jgi:DNA-binding response OmpR family regulator
MYSQSNEFLVVGRSDVDRDYFRLLFPTPRWTVHFRSSLAQAATFLRLRPLKVILSGDRLPDGTWGDLIDAVADSSNPPLVIVTSRCADERMWAEVLNRGGYDVLVEPFDAAEVRRVVTMALSRRPDANSVQELSVQAAV